jgi:hypothetical protein
MLLHRIQLTNIRSRHGIDAELPYAQQEKYSIVRLELVLTVQGRVRHCATPRQEQDMQLIRTDLPYFFVASPYSGECRIDRASFVPDPIEPLGLRVIDISCVTLIARVVVWKAIPYSVFE